MKKATLLFISFSLLITSICLVQCEKNSTPVNITLNDKPVSVIRAYIMGKWRVHYTFGGLCGTCISDREAYDEYYEFTADNRIKYTFNDVLQEDISLTWTTHQMGGWDYVHNIMAGRFEPYKIVNDTLLLAQPFLNCPDYDLLFLTKVK